MRYLLAFLPPDRLDALVEAVPERHLQGLSVSEARGFDHAAHRRPAGADFVRKMRVEIVCHDREVDDLLAAFYQTVHNGRMGDGKVFVINLEDAFGLKTAERGEAVIGPAP
jgi:nitrogen regulatory protein PII